MEASDAESRTALRKAHELGRAIVSESPYTSGMKISLPVLMEKLNVSRPMAREVLQVLQAKRLVALRQRAGATVLGSEEWDLFDPDVINWQLESDARWAQLGKLTELREAIEPRAAHLAAGNPSAEPGRALVRLSRELRELGQDVQFGRVDGIGEKHRQRYCDVDIEFHTALLGGSGNGMFRALARPAAEALKFRIQQDWAGTANRHSATGFDTGTPTPFPQLPEPIALWLHCGLAHAINQRLPEAAEAFARAILAELRPGGLDQAILRYGLRVALAQLDRAGFEAGEWDEFEKAIAKTAREPIRPIVVMGVAGCGKTTVGTLLAQRLGVSYVEADDLHPGANVAKMAEGTPLTDDDRHPWLAAVAEQISAHANTGIVVSCSALKRRYRDVLRAADPRAWFLHLDLDQNTASRRVADRADHFMPTSLVASQFESLEPLDGEVGYTVDATADPELIITAALGKLTGL